MNDDQLIKQLLISQNKVWEDKKRLGLINDKKPASPVSDSTRHQHDKTSASSLQDLPPDVRDNKKSDLISKLTSSEGLAGLGAQKHWQDKRSPRGVSPLPDDIRETKKEELISRLSSSDGLLRLGEFRQQSQHSRTATPVPDDLRERKKEELISRLSSSDGLLHLGEYRQQPQRSRTATPIPDDVRECKKEELISRLSSPDGLLQVGEHKLHSPRYRATPPLPGDVRESKKEEFISKLSSPEGLTHLGEHKEKRSPRAVSPLPDDVRESKKEELISRLVSSEGLVNLGEKQQSHHSRVTSALPNDVRESKKEEFISKLSSPEGLTHLGEHKEKKLLSLPGNEKDELISRLTAGQGLVGEETESMVRFGEYSPQNPGLLSPGKTLLGLGEYEEKRRQILERKKREYLEQMAQARQAVKEVKPQPEAPEFFLKTFMNSVATQTDPKLTGYIEGEDGVSPIVASTQTPGGEIPAPTLAIVSPQSHITTISTQTSGGNLRQQRHQPSPPPVFIASHPSPSYLPLSPRERKLAEFRESYSPSFLQGLPMRQGGFDMGSEPDMRRRREAYQEELRKQIEEKRRLEAEELEKERQKEVAIARRTELQREQMRQEYIEEEAVRRERHLLRMRQAEEFLRKQEALKLEMELEREAEARRKLEKRLEELEAGLAQHTTCAPSQNLGVSLPVPALRSKLLKEAAQSQEPEKPDASADHKPKTTYSPQFSESEYSVRGSHSDYNLNRYSPVKDSTEPVATISYHRPPTDVIRAAGYSENAPCLYDENRNSVPDFRTGQSDVPSEEVCQDKKKLDDTLSIPILRAPSPVIPAARLGKSSTRSEAIQRLEGKWQVPAVEKTVINPDSNRILTQLGAVRHQLQLEQMRMEQQLQQRLKHQAS